MHQNLFKKLQKPLQSATIPQNAALAASPFVPVAELVVRADLLRKLISIEHGKPNACNPIYYFVYDYKITVCPFFCVALSEKSRYCFIDVNFLMPSFLHIL